jgi:hypothetical protein
LNGKRSATFYKTPPSIDLFDFGEKDAKQGVNGTE